LFLSAFGAATFLPLSSEVTLVALLNNSSSFFTLWLIATAGNTLGSCVNWFLGRYLRRFESRSWFPFDSKKMTRVESWYQRYGIWSLLISWVPIVGDPLTFVSGVMRAPFVLFLFLVTLAKGGRYALVIYLFVNI
jgi:membrane protein YqaA with SNARE-associated domain